ncbi:hypothetical protein COO60DRAFT_1623901 [Scenedesmus sp. NREL 46B-D3]|nr:hypothetical protein COO60DRAFT_1623901 [Scenedesmus sp. NREL 46B-D3]
MPHGKAQGRCCSATSARRPTAEAPLQAAGAAAGSCKTGYTHIWLNGKSAGRIYVRSTCSLDKAAQCLPAIALAGLWHMGRSAPATAGILPHPRPANLPQLERMVSIPPQASVTASAASPNDSMAMIVLVCLGFYALSATISAAIGAIMHLSGRPLNKGSRGAASWTDGGIMDTFDIMRLPLAYEIDEPASKISGSSQSVTYIPWDGPEAAYIPVSLAKLAQTPEDPWSAGYLTAATLLSLAGLAVLLVVRAAAPPGPARVMGILAAVIYGIIPAEPGSPGTAWQPNSATCRAWPPSCADRQHSRLRPASSSSLLRVLASRSFGSVWGGAGSVSQQQQRHRGHRSTGALKSSISWADLAAKPAGGAATDGTGSDDHLPGPVPQQPAVWDQAPPVTAAQLGLLVGRAKAILPAARLEPHWLRPEGLVQFDADAWAGLLEDAELLLVRWGLLRQLLLLERLQLHAWEEVQSPLRVCDQVMLVSTLEALSDERRLQGLQLHHLKHYRNIADAMAMTLAQLAAFLAHVSKAVEQQQASRHMPGWVARLLRKISAAAAQATRQHKLPMQQTHQQPQQQQSFYKVHAPAGHTAAGRSSPFATASVAAAAAAGLKADGEAAGAQDDVSWSAVLSGLERQGSGVSSYLWERKGGWETGRQLLLREIESSAGSYWWAVRRATKQAPVQVPRSREPSTAVMTLTFIWPITNGLLDALERVEASAQRVLATRHRQHRQQPQPQPQQQAGQSRPRGCLSSMQAWRREQQQWLQPLLALLAIKPFLQAVKQALCKDLPHALSSKQGFSAMLASRSFQAGAKLLLATGSALALTMLLMAYDVRVRSLAPIFGFTSVCLSMQERVEATTEKVVGRILGTIVGACLGLGITHIPGIFGAPVLLLACIAAASVPLSMLAKAEARTGVALALLTLLAVALCTYELACCVPGAHLMSPVTVFLARLGSVVGACIYVALLSRLLLPWYTSDYALEQMADALEQAAALFEKIYTSQHNRMRVAALAAGGSVPPVEANGCEAAAAAAAGGGETGVLDSAAAAAELAALESGEAALHVALRQEVLRRLVAVQLSLAKDTVSWRRGVLATPQIVLDVLGAMIELVEALACQRLALAPFTRHGTDTASSPGAAAGGGAAPSGLLRVSGHCYSVWAQPLHPVWLQGVAYPRPQRVTPWNSARSSACSQLSGVQGTIGLTGAQHGHNSSFGSASEVELLEIMLKPSDAPCCLGVSPPVRSGCWGGAANPWSHDRSWKLSAYSASSTNLQALRELDSEGESFSGPRTVVLASWCWVCRQACQTQQTAQTQAAMAQQLMSVLPSPATLRISWARRGRMQCHLLCTWHSSSSSRTPPANIAVGGPAAAVASCQTSAAVEQQEDSGRCMQQRWQRQQHRRQVLSCQQQHVVGLVRVRASATLLMQYYHL